jgi:hypothetical protein
MLLLPGAQDPPKTVHYTKEASLTSGAGAEWGRGVGRRSMQQGLYHSGQVDRR